MASSCTISTSPASLRSLRHRLTGPAIPSAALPLGDERIDAYLPGGGLPLGRWHEISATGPDMAAGALGAGFTACLLARVASALPVLWVAPCCDLYAPGLLD